MYWPIRNGQVYKRECFSVQNHSSINNFIITLWLSFQIKSKTMQPLIAVLLFASLCFVANAQYGHGGGYGHGGLVINHVSHGGYGGGHGGYGGYGHGGGYGGHSTGHSSRYDIRAHGYGGKRLFWKLLNLTSVK